MMSWSERDLADYVARRNADLSLTVAELAAPKVPKARQPRTGYRSKTEEAFGHHCDLMLRAAEIDNWRYEPVSLVLAPGVRYLPDFLTVKGGAVTFWEIKGRKGEAYWTKPLSKAKIRMAAELFRWWDFRIAWKSATPGMWNESKVGGEG